MSTSQIRTKKDARMKRRDVPKKMSATFLVGATVGQTLGSAGAFPTFPYQTSAESLRSLAARRGLLV